VFSAVEGFILFCEIQSDYLSHTAFGIVNEQRVNDGDNKANGKVRDVTSHMTTQKLYEKTNKN
jgi:hypothetical protein